MNNDYDLTTKLDKEALEWVIDNYSNVEKVTPRMLMKLMDLKTSEPERWQQMANIKFGV